MSDSKNNNFVQQVVVASENVVQVAGDYIQNTTNNIRKGNWAVAVPQILLLLIIAAMLLKLVNTGITSLQGNNSLSIAETELTDLGIDINSRVFDEGTVSFLGVGSTEVFIIANNDSSVFTVRSAPLSEYQSKRIDLGENSAAEGEITIINDSYQFGTEGSTAFIQLDTNPMDDGQFVRGHLKGKVFKGNSAKELDYELILPIGSL